MDRGRPTRLSSKSGCRRGEQGGEQPALGWRGRSCARSLPQPPPAEQGGAAGQGRAGHCTKLLAG